MNNKPAIIPVAGLLALYIVGFNLIAFLYVEEFTGNFWSGYVFTIVSWVCLAINAFVAVLKGRITGIRIFMSIPHIVCALIYALFQLIAGLLIMLAAYFDLKASIIIQFVLLALYLVTAFMLAFYKSKTTVNIKDRQANTAFKSAMLIDIANLKSRCQNEGAKKRLKEIETLLRYSDPVSSSDTYDFEIRISEIFEQVKANLLGDQSRVVFSALNEIEQLLKQRNTVCAANKQK